MPRRVIALAAAVLLLAGCTPALDRPVGLTEAQVEQRRADEAAAWWSSMFPDDPPPDVVPVGYVDPMEPGSAVIDCMRAAKLPGVLYGDNSWNTATNDPAQLDAMNRQWWICTQQYPYAFTPENSPYLSDAQLAWIWSYNKERLVPCLQLLGYTVPNRTSDYIPGSNELWMPAWEMVPFAEPSEWARIDLKCPPSPIGPTAWQY